MKSILNAFLLSIVGVIFSCSQRVPNFCGTWIREIEDSGLGVNGVERITFQEDSSVVIENEMRMLYADSNMHCTFIFATSICGNWEFSGTNMDINLNIETYEFTVDSTKTDVTAVRAENFIPAENIKLLTDDLSLAVSDFYKSVYLESPQISIEDISFLNNGRFIGYYGNSLILWQRL